MLYRFSHTKSHTKIMRHRGNHKNQRNFSCLHCILLLPSHHLICIHLFFISPFCCCCCCSFLQLPTIFFFGIVSMVSLYMYQFDGAARSVGTTIGPTITHMPYATIHTLALPIIWYNAFLHENQFEFVYIHINWHLQ